MVGFIFSKVYKGAQSCWENGMKTLFLAFLIFMPSKIKIFFYRLLGAKIGKNCYIGLSIVNARKIDIGDFVYIGHFNLIWRLQELKIGSGARINYLNWIAGANKGSFSLQKNSSISGMHYFDSSADITIGSNSIIAGRSSQFFTHGITPDNLDSQGSIIIGDWCYVGSAVRFVPGSRIADHTFVGMGAVLTKAFEEDYVLLTGVPARIKKTLSKNEVFFSRPFLPHAHHPSCYKGS